MIFPQILIGAVLACISSALPQGLTKVAINNPNVRNQAPSGTWFSVPVYTHHFSQTAFPRANIALYSDISPGQYSAQGKLIIAPNTLSGPGVIESIYDLDFTTTKSPPYTEHTFHSVINQLVILNSGMCLRNTIYFNEIFSDPELRIGTITFYSPHLPIGFSGVYHAGGF
ncbi:hypothetical protein BKA65DRAFT_597965 [Rhexocercosporidium sp. MPI-PUGE-AT-0058]|nr:hypothetical protein BKA65DRAFT_597965 [Rhexocercosporidium sp. MPI-PUGE-AT-0058]